MEPSQARADVEYGRRVLETELAAIRDYRRAWGLFRDRRPDLYAPLLTLDGGAD